MADTCEKKVILMDDLQRAITWLETQVWDDDISFDGEPDGCEQAYLEHLQNCRALLDALRKEPCDRCIDCQSCANNGRVFCYQDCDDSVGAERSGRVAYKHFKAKHKHCPHCGRPLPKPPESDAKQVTNVIQDSLQDESEG